jgi:hypothetical protein
MKIKVRECGFHDLNITTAGGIIEVNIMEDITISQDSVSQDLVMFSLGL